MTGFADLTELKEIAFMGIEKPRAYFEIFRNTATPIIPFFILFFSYQPSHQYYQEKCTV